MTNYFKTLRVEGSSKVKLADVDPEYHGKNESHEAALPEIQANLARLDELQYLLYAERKHSLLIVLQGLDAGGKDGVIRHVITGMNPAGCRVAGFKQPTPAELGHDFLWRVHPHVPEKGEVVVFNRSQYEDVLVVRVHKLAPKKVWSQRYDIINDFEKLLVEQNNTMVLKFFLYISKDEQLARFKQRLDDPARQWKISDSDYTERDYWDDYIVAFEEMLERTSTPHAPWYIIPSNHKWFRNLAVSQIIAQSLENLNMKMPEPTVDIAAIRKQYHAAAADEKASKRK